MDKNLKLLLKYIREEDVALFIGSGFSLKAGAPRVSELNEMILNEGGEDFAKELDINEKNNLRILSQKFIEYRGRHDLMEILRKAFNFTPKDISDQNLLTKIPHIKLIFTTNYDTLIEDAYKEKYVIDSNKNCSYVTDKFVSIYKLHGNILPSSNPDNIVITDKDYEKYFMRDDNNLLYLQLKHALINKHVVFIGYSLNDENILNIINYIKKALGDNMKRMFFVSPDITDEKLEFLKDKEISPIKLKAEDVLNEAISELKLSVSEDYIEKKISSETYAQFCNKIGHVNPTTTIMDGKNVIESAKVEPGFPKKESFNISISKNQRDLITKRLFTGSMNIPDTEIEIPNIEIKKPEISSFNHTINGIDFTSLYEPYHIMVVPSYKTTSANIRMDEIDFLESVTIYSYVDKENTIRLSFETPVFIVYIDICKSISNPIPVKISFKPAKHYKSYNDAMLWCKFFEYIFKGCNFYINSEVFNAKASNKEGLEFINWAKDYYKLVRNIEKEMNIKFNVYENVSKDNYENALYIYHYKKSLPLENQIPENMTVYDTTTNDKDFIMEMQNYKDAFFYFKTLAKDGVCKLNGVKVTIPFIEKTYFNCICKVYSNNDSTIRYEFKSKCNYCKMLFSDVEINDKQFEYKSIGSTINPSNNSI